jgi:hypothetical protein
MAMRFVPEMFPILEHLSFSILENPRNFTRPKVLDPIIKFPALKSFTFGVYDTKQSFINDLCNGEAATEFLIFQNYYMFFIRKLIEQKKLEVYFYICKIIFNVFFKASSSKFSSFCSSFALYVFL